MSAAIIIAARCNWCSRQQSPNDILPLPTGQAMCRKCYEGHHHGLQVLSGETPRGCWECGLTVEQLNALHNGPTTRMYVVQKDGVYAVLCATCKEAYCPKRSDLYKGTEFGEAMKL